MSEADRETILRALRRASRPPRPPASPSVVPARGHRDSEGQASLFADEAERVDAAVVRLADLAALPDTVAGILAAEGVAPALRVAPDSLLDTVPWTKRQDLVVTHGAARPDDRAAVVVAFAGVAETGTVMLVSGPDNPTTLNFLSDIHIVVLPLGRLVGTYEEAWKRLRACGDDFMPRAVNWITGPSRTADIERKLLLGVHGPRRLYILMIDEQV